MTAVKHLPVYKGAFELSGPVLSPGGDLVEDSSLVVHSFRDDSKAYPCSEALPIGLFDPASGQVFWPRMITKSIDKSYDSAWETVMKVLQVQS